MAIIPQRTLFSWEEIEPLGDLERLPWVVERLCPMRISCGHWKPPADAGETIIRSERCGIPCGPG